MQKVRFTLNNGKNIDLELYPEHAPISVENFLDLVKNGFYDGLCFEYTYFQFQDVQKMLWKGGEQNLGSGLFFKGSKVRNRKTYFA